MFGKLTVEQRLHKAVANLLNQPQLAALCGVLLIGERKAKVYPPGKPFAAYTDGKNETYNETYVVTITDKQLRGLILHETGHKMMRHLITWKHLWDVDPRRTNKAADYVVNQWIMDEIAGGVDAELYPGALYDPKYKGLNVQQVYDLLPQGGGGDGGDDGDGEPLDEHDWEGADDMDDADKQALEQEIDAALRQGAMVAGKMGSGGNRLVDELLKPRVDWRQVLREFVSATCQGNDYGTWSRPNRRYVGAGLYMPSGISESVGELVVGIDTSGSIGGRELSQFLGEVVGICEQVKPERIRLLYWDTEVCADEVYELDQLSSLVHSTKPAGGGGTDASCIPAYMARKNIRPQAAVILTDGYVCSWGSWSVPVLWCVIGSRAVPPVGKVVYVED